MVKSLKNYVLGKLIEEAKWKKEAHDLAKKVSRQDVVGMFNFRLLAVVGVSIDGRALDREDFDDYSTSNRPYVVIGRILPSDKVAFLRFRGEPLSQPSIPIVAVRLKLEDVVVRLFDRGLDFTYKWPEDFR